MMQNRSRPAKRVSIDLSAPDAYGRSFETVYDTWYDGVTDADMTARFIATHHRGGPVLELGVGTGRLAGPLAEFGLQVIGLDASMAMLNQRGDQRWSAVQGAFQQLPFSKEARFGTVLLAFNTIFNLSQESAQQALFHQVAGLLAPDATFIIEALDVTNLVEQPRRAIGSRSVRNDAVVVTATQFKRSTQQVTGHHLEIDDAGVLVRPWMLRWSTPAQLDTMAQAAGLRLVNRLHGWDPSVKHRISEAYVSVYGQAI